jgi:hypothetical protein
MRKDWIMTEGEREEKRRKIQENRQRKKDPNGNSDTESNVHLNDSNGGNMSGNECSMSATNNNEGGCFTDDNNNSFGCGETNKSNKPIRRRRRRRRHSQTEMQTNMDVSSNTGSVSANVFDANKLQTKSFKPTTITADIQDEHHIPSDQAMILNSTNKNIENTSSTNNSNNNNNNKNSNFSNSFSMLSNNSQQQKTPTSKQNNTNINSHSSSMANLLKPNPYLNSINQIALCNVSEKIVY